MGFYPMVQGKLSSPEPIFCNNPDCRETKETTMFCFAVGGTNKLTKTNIPYHYYQCERCGRRMIKLLIWENHLSFIERDDLFAKKES